jgi:hypothetical protein
VARLELEWWIVHREVDDHPPGDLEAALAALAAELYHGAPGEVADDEQQPRGDRDHGRRRHRDREPSSSSRAASRTPAPAGMTSSGGPLAKAAANAPVHCSHSSAPPSVPAGTREPP